MELTKSPVIYDAVEHKYYLNGKELSGITSQIKKHIFPNLYNGIPQWILDKAAAYGHYVHEICDIIDSLGVEHPAIEAQNYLSLVDKNHLRHIASEFVVSDLEAVASPIDKVYQSDEYAENEFILGDIKTTRELDVPYLEWQLSIYAHLFEKQCKGAKVVKLIAIWLRNDEHAEIREINRIPDKHIGKLLTCIRTGEEYTNEYIRVDENLLPSCYSDMEIEIAKLAMLRDKINREYDELKEAMMQAMVRVGAYRWDGNNITIVRKKDCIQKRFDKEQLKKDHPDICALYEKEIPCVGSVTISVDKQFVNDHEVQLESTLRDKSLRIVSQSSD